MTILKQVTITGTPADGTAVSTSNTNLVGVNIRVGNTFTTESAAAMGAAFGLRANQGGANQIDSYLDLASPVTKLGWRREFRYGTTPTLSCSVLRFFPDTVHTTNLGTISITSANRGQFVEGGTGSPLNVTSPSGASLMAAGSIYVELGLIDCTANTFEARVYPYGSGAQLFTISGTLGADMAAASGIQSIRHGINTASAGLGNYDINSNFALGDDWVARTDYTEPTDPGASDLIDWDASGVFTGPYADITPDVRPGHGAVTFTYGREPGGNSPTTAGSGGMVLDNRTRKYSPRNSSSPLTGKIKPRRPVKIARNIGGTDYTLFRGFTDETPINPDPDSKTVAPALLDALAGFRGPKITTELYRGIRSGDAVGLVLDAVGWTGGRDLDSGASVFRYWQEPGTDALTALDKIVRSEGYPAFVRVGEAGEIIFRDRFHRVTRATSTTSQSTWRGSGQLEPVMATGLKYDDGWANIVNHVECSYLSDFGELLDPVETLHYAEDLPLTVSAGSPVTIPITAGGPVKNLVLGKVRANAGGSTIPPPSGDIPLVGTHATLTATEGINVGIELSVDSGSAKFWSVTVTGQKMVAEESATSGVVATALDQTSIDAYGEHAETVDLPWCNEYDAIAIAARIIADRKDPLPVVDARFMVGRNEARAGALLPRKLSDRVTIIEPETALNDPFHVEKIQHTFTGEHDHEMVITCEMVPPTTYPDLFILDQSVLGTGRLG